MPRAFDLKLERGWRNRFQQFQRSGLSVREYCRSQAIQEHTFFWWRRELARRDRLRRDARSDPSQAPRNHSVAKRSRVAVQKKVISGRVGTRAEVAQRWTERLARWRQSGYSIEEFCRIEKLNRASFYQWRKRLAGARSLRHTPNRAAAFLPVQVISDSFPSLCMEIRLGDFLLRIPTTIEERSLRQVIRIVREEVAAPC